MDNGGVTIGDLLPDVSQNIDRKSRVRNVADAYDTDRETARRLLERFGFDAELHEIPREELQEVHGVGPATAEKINPPRTRLATECWDVDYGVLLPMDPPKGGDLRVGFIPSTARRGVEVAASDAHALVWMLAEESNGE